MANWEPVWSATDNFEAGYQAMVNDSANYCPAKGKPGSQLIGTNHGISAIGYAQYNHGKCPTVIEIKALQKSKAKTIAKQQYWDPIQGDKINSQAIAHLVFDFTFAGSSGTKQVRQAINAIKGPGTVKEFASFNLSDAEIKLINSIPEKTLFNKLVEIRRNFYQGNTFQTGLTNRLNKLAGMYAGVVKNAVATTNKYMVPLIIGSLALATTAVIIITNINKK